MSGCGVMIAIAVALIIVAGMCGAADDGDEPDATEDLEFGAFDVCTQFVKDRLKSPGSAEFRNYFEDDGEVIVTGSGNGPYTVMSSVDSQNGFGAMIRTDFVCEVTNTGGENWRLVNLVVDE